MDGRAQMDAILRSLTSAGWCFRDVDETIDALTALGTTTAVVGEKTMEAELLNMDLREIGGRSLPDPSLLKKSSHLQGPKVLQACPQDVDSLSDLDSTSSVVVSVRDVHQSSMEVSFKNSKRLLMFCLTDGYSEVTAIEYTPLLSIPEEIIPGTKIRLENKVPIHSGILCLESKMITVLGGLVQSLYEEWQINRKYSGFSRSQLKLSQNTDSVGPPPFEKLEVGSHLQGCKPQSSYTMLAKLANLFKERFYEKHIGSSEVIAKNMVQPHPERCSDAIRGRGIGGYHGAHETHVSDATVQSRSCITESTSEGAEEKSASSSSRPKEISDAVPIQNQAAAQKLFGRMNKPDKDGRQPMRGRGTRQRGKGKAEEPAVFTLDEWEKRKSTTGISGKLEAGLDVRSDEEIARQLQRQLNLEDEIFAGCHESEADRIRMSMFDFGREGKQAEGGRVGRGRGRGRGRRRFG
ncbi:Tudor domain-containing protein 3 [Nymphaea thermarum]|nr:Tudor domain-containing protein 3 [Nymphaea thermarum]